MYYFVTIAREACRNELVDAGSGSADRPQAAHLHRLLTGFPPICGMQPNSSAVAHSSSFCQEEPNQLAGERALEPHDAAPAAAKRFCTAPHAVSVQPMVLVRACRPYGMHTSPHVPPLRLLCMTRAPDSPSAWPAVCALCTAADVLFSPVCMRHPLQVRSGCAACAGEARARCSIDLRGGAVRPHRVVALCVAAAAMQGRL